MKKFALDWRPNRWTVLSALLIVVSFPPWDFLPTIWIALVPWFVALERTRSRKDAAIQGLWLSFFMSMGGFYWVAFVLKQFGGLPWALAIVGLLLFGLIGQPQFTIFAPLFRETHRRLGALPSSRGLGVAAALALLYTGVDWFIPKLFVDTLGHAFYNADRMRQVADVGGAPLLTFLVFWVNYTLWSLFRNWSTQKNLKSSFRLTQPMLLTALGLCVVAYTYGWLRNRQVQTWMSQPRSQVQLGVIQANIGDFDKIAAEQGVRGAAQKILTTYFEHSDRALAQNPKPHALVWPETSYPSTFRTPQTVGELERDRKLEEYVRSRGVPVYFGGYDQSGGKDFNAFFFLSPTPNPGVSGQGDLQIYRKHILLLFGEYIPGAESISLIRNAFPQVGNFGRGVGPEVLRVPTLHPEVPSLRVGPVICYEALFASYIREAALNGSQLILNITNDSWFGPYGEPQLHLALTTFRSIESRLPQLRATNTGISALIRPDGEITQPTPLFEPAILNAPVPIYEMPLWTLMLAWGDWFGPTALVGGMLLLFGIGYRGGKFRRG